MSQYLKVPGSRKPEISGIIQAIVCMLFLIPASCHLFAQGEILSINPPSAFQGETVNIVIQGSGTDFSPEATQVQFDDCGVSVNEVIVYNSELLSVHVSISKTSDPGMCGLIVHTSTQQLGSEFEIIRLGEDVETMINLFPVENMAIADYDISAPETMPLLFNVLVYPAGKTYLRVEAKLIHEEYGLLVTAEKELINPGFITEFNNRMFDGYDISKSSDEILDAVGGGGLVPPGIYTYVLTVFNENNVQVASIDAGFYIDDASSGIELFTPGNSLDSDPEIIHTPNPEFQWTGAFGQYELRLYEVTDDQVSPGDITSGVPVFSIDKLTANTLLYPVYAEALQKGRRYAWQVSSSMTTSSRNNEILSELYWFDYQEPQSAPVVAESMQISPEDCELHPGDSIQVKVELYSGANLLPGQECSYQVVPSDGGRIDRNGWFIAGKKAQVVAVKVRCASLEDFITIRIKK